MDIDKIPIGVNPTNRMDFEQLLEEKLKISEQLEEEQARLGSKKSSSVKKKPPLSDVPPDEDQQQSQPSNPPSRQPRVFLKKGEGLKKYMPKTTKASKQEQAKNRLSSGSTTTMTRVTSSKTTSTTPNNKNAATVDSNLRKISNLTENAIKMATTSSSNLRAQQVVVKKASPEPQSTSSLAKTNSLSSVSSSSLGSISSDQKLRNNRTESLTSLNEKKQEGKRVRVIEPPKNYKYDQDDDDHELREFETMEQYLTEHPSINIPHGDLVPYTQKQNSYTPYNEAEIVEVEEIDEYEYSNKHQRDNIYDRVTKFQETQDNDMTNDDEYDEYYKRYRNYTEETPSVEEQIKHVQVSKRKVKRLSDNESFDCSINVQETRTTNYVLDDDSQWAVDQKRQTDIDSDFEGDEFKPSRVSNYMNTLFPSLKTTNKPQHVEKTANLRSNSKSSLNENSSANNNNSNNITNALLKEKYQQLENEIKKLIKENEEVEKFKAKLNEEIKLTEASRKVAFKQREEEIESLKRNLEEEMRKLKIERKVFEQYKQSCKENPTRKEREEIETLKKQVQELQNELRSKEARWIANNNRLKERIESLEQENGEQKRALQLIEKQRLEMLVKKTTATTSPHTSNGFKPNTLNTGDSDYNIYDMSRDRVHSPFDDEVHSNLLTREKGLTSKHSSSSLASSLSPEYFTSLLTKKKLRVLEVRRKEDQVEKVLEDGTVIGLFANGTVKETDPECKRMYVKFHNGDYKDVDLKNKTDTYYHHDTQTISKTDLVTKNQVITFPNGQIDKIFADGAKEITYPSTTVRKKMPDGSIKTVIEKGLVVFTAQNGDKIVEYPNGQREISTKEYKKREFPDGSWKILYSDGSTEARYPNGRIIRKDAQRNVISNTKESC